jgi:hypothetical protein
VTRCVDTFPQSVGSRASPGRQKPDKIGTGGAIFVATVTT